MKKEIFILVCSCLVLLSSCGESSPSSSINDETNKIDLIIGTTSKIERATRDEYNFDVLTASVSQLPLIGQNAADGTYYPQLCDYEIISGDQIKFTVREGMKWSDGVDVTAEDIKHTFDYLDKRTGSYFVDILDDSNNIKTQKKFRSAEILENNRSILLNLQTNNVRAFASLLDLRIQPKHIYENYMEIDDGYPSDEDSRIGCGPFAFKEFNKSSNSIKFERNQYYPFNDNENTDVNSLTYILYGNEDVMNVDLSSGKIDLTWTYSNGTSVESQKALSKFDNLSFYDYAKKGVSSTIVFNCSKFPGNDINFRNAVSYAIDYDRAKLNFGSEKSSNPNRSFVPTSTTGFVETTKLTKNLEKSKEFINKLGYENINNDGFYEKDGNELTLNLSVNSENAAHVRYADFVKTCLAEAGIKVNIDGQSTNDFRIKTTNKFAKDAGFDAPTHEACILGFTSAGMDMMDGLGSIYVNKNHEVQGVAQVSESNFEDILKSMSSSANFDEYAKNAANLQYFYDEYLPVIALFWDSNVNVYNNKYTNLVADSLWGLNSLINWMNIKVK